MKRLGAIFVLLVMIVLAVSSTQSLAKANDVLHLYTALDPNEAKVYLEAFTKDTKINVDWVRLSAGELLTRLKAEAKRPQVSVWYGGSCVEFIAGKKAGVLTPYKSKIVSPLKDPEDYWIGFYFGAIGFGSNTTIFEKNKWAYPTSWNDLLKPEFKANIGLAYPYTSGTSYTMLATLVQLMGEDKAFEYWKKLDTTNIHHYNTSGSAAVTQCGLGEVAIAIGFSHDIVAKGVSKGYPVKMTFPKDGTGYEIGSLGLVKGGPEPELGQKFIDWCLSKRAQNLMKFWFRIALNPEAEIAEGAVKQEDVTLVKWDNEWIGNNQARLIEKWRQTIGK